MSLFALLAVVCACSDVIDANEGAAPEAGRPASFHASAGKFGTPLFDPAPAWPLCGRITDDPPKGWKPEDGCLADRFGNPDYTDAPLNNTYGPRQLPSQNFRYDFHRGLDIAADSGTPIFAIADGIVQKAGVYSGYTDPLIQIRHLRPGKTSCKSGDGCYTSQYQHISGWVVHEDDVVSKGDLIGYTGLSSGGNYAHLHFEIRNAPGKHDSKSAWSRDAIHPLEVLPYHDTGTANMDVTIENVDTMNPMNPIVDVQVVMPMTVELDLRRVEVVPAVRRDGPGGPVLSPITQKDGPVGTTMDGEGYYVRPPWYDLVHWNRQYTYKDNTKYPYSVFQTGGAYQSPYHATLPGSYSASIHMDQASPMNDRVGDFNGVEMAPAYYSDDTSHYTLDLKFKALRGTEDASSLCVLARAVDVRGNASPWATWNCGGATLP